MEVDGERNGSLDSLLDEYDISYDRYNSSDSNNYAVSPWIEYAYQINRVKIDNEIKPKVTSCWFCGMERLTTIDGLENLNTSEVTDMSYMFAYCDSLKDLDLKTFDTSKVTNMDSMFRMDSSSNLTVLNLENFNTSNVENMSNMFRFFNGEKLDLNSFDTSKVKDMSAMFYNHFCYRNLKNIEIHVGSKWNIENVEDKKDMFRGCIGEESCIEYDSF